MTVLSFKKFKEKIRQKKLPKPVKESIEEYQAEIKALREALSDVDEFGQVHYEDPSGIYGCSMLKEEAENDLEAKEAMVEFLMENTPLVESQ